MSRSTEVLLRWGKMAWLATFAVLSGLVAGEVLKRSASPSVWAAPPHLAQKGVQYQQKFLTPIYEWVWTQLPPVPLASELQAKGMTINKLH